MLDLERLIDDCSTWGQWGADDELGALNYIGPDQVLAAVGTVTEGRPYSLAVPFDETGPQSGKPRTNPKLLMTLTGSDHVGAPQVVGPGQTLPDGFGVGDDFMVMPTQSATHIDGLAHIYWRGKMYNGHSAAAVTTRGAQKCGIENTTDKMVTRGVLVDVARHHNTAALEPGYAIAPEELDDILAAEQVQARQGDCLLIRTGFLGQRRTDWGDFAGGDAPGLSLRTARWLHEKKTSIVGADTWGVEVRPNEVAMYQPLHVTSLVHGGIYLAEIFDLDELALACADLRRWEFLFVAAPLPLTGACGSPLNPIAIL